jgi:DNA modification methylase
MIDVVHADSYEWIKTQPDKSFDHVITDFVYGMIFPFDDLLRITKGNIITFCSDIDYPFKPTERAYWIKTPSTKNYTKHIGRFVEHIFIYRQNAIFNCLHWSQMTGVYTDLVDNAEGHQWRKPLSLVERLVRIYTNPEDRILDPFCGSGTMLEASERWGRDSIGIDNDKVWINYCQKKFNLGKEKE